MLKNHMQQCRNVDLPQHLLVSYFIRHRILLLSEVMIGRVPVRTGVLTLAARLKEGIGTGV
ncbi:hypothetical protein J43TS9_11490 [Paenibacillus cineris]|nr:hypothetical protein J43TS9_11490 [Paenibacillus cineris]